MGETMSARLNQYLMHVSSMPFEWSRNDCATLCADWCVENGHHDPMARWRNQYRWDIDASAVMRDAGGLGELWSLGMIDAQIPECDEPRLGDVALVMVQGENGPEPVGAIYGGKRFYMLSPNGLFCASMAPEHVIKTWRV